MYLGSHLTDYSPPGGQQPPPEVVRGLREIDPRMELVYVGDGVWRLGKVEFASDRHQKACEVYRNALKKLQRVRAGDLPHEVPWDTFLAMASRRLKERYLLVQGFQPIPRLKLRHHHLHSGLVEYFRYLDWGWKFAWIEDRKEQERQEDGTADLERRTAEAVDRVQAEGKSIYRKAFRHPVSRRGKVDFKDGQIVRPKTGAQA